MALLSQKHLVRFFINGVVAGFGDALTGSRVGFAFLARQQGNDLVDRKIHLCVIFGLPADDERCARLVNQDRVHLVDDGVVQLSLHTVGRLVHHVVAQIVKPVLVVGAVGDVGVVGRLLFFPRHVGQIDADAQSQEVVQLAHPAGIAAGQVIIDRHHMHALASQRIEVNRQRCGQGFSFPSPHFRNFSVVQRHAAHHLYVEVAHFHDAFAAFAHHGKCLWKQVVQRFASSYTVFELLGLGAQLIFIKLFILRLQCVDAFNRFTVSLEQPVVATAENFGQDVGSHKCEAANGRSRELALQAKSLIEYGT